MKCSVCGGDKQHHGFIGDVSFRARFDVLLKRPRNKTTGFSIWGEYFCDRCWEWLNSECDFANLPLSWFYYLDPQFIADMQAVFERGSAKQGRGHWKDRDIDVMTEFEAMQRHCGAWLLGEVIDPESGKPHMAHITDRAQIIAYKERGDR